MYYYYVSRPRNSRQINAMLLMLMLCVYVCKQKDQENEQKYPSSLPEHRRELN